MLHWRSPTLAVARADAGSVQTVAVVETYIPADRLSMKTKLTLEILFEEDG